MNWEKSNPLRTDEQTIVVKRGGRVPIALILLLLFVIIIVVLFAYNQCLLCFCYCPDIWYGAISYLQKMCETQVSIIIQ